MKRAELLVQQLQDLHVASFGAKVFSCSASPVTYSINLGPYFSFGMVFGSAATMRCARLSHSLYMAGLDPSKTSSNCFSSPTPFIPTPARPNLWFALRYLRYHCETSLTVARHSKLFQLPRLEPRFGRTHMLLLCLCKVLRIQGKSPVNEGRCFTYTTKNIKKSIVM